MKKNIIIVLLSTLILLYGLFRATSCFLVGFDFNVVSSKTSPDGVYTIFEIESMSEGGHAPYGHELVLSSRKHINHAAQGDVIFAGYCHRPLTYAWQSDKNIQIVCTSNEKQAVRTRVTMVQGINIETIIKEIEGKRARVD